MTYVRLNTDGRLLSFETVGDPTGDVAGASDSVDWSRLFKEAGIDPSELDPIEGGGLELSEKRSSWRPQVLTPAVPFDHMRAWVGRSPWGDGDTIKVRAGAFRGRPVFFAVDIAFVSRHDSTTASQGRAMPAPAAHKAGETSADTAAAGVSAAEQKPGRSAEHYAGEVIGLVLGIAVLALAVGVLLGGPLMAWRHLRMGKGDRRGALRFGLFALGLILLSSLLLAHHTVIFEGGSLNLGYEWNLIITKLGTAVLYGAYVALAYLALEPYVRRHWPDALISWTRLVSGRIGDPLVGRDLLLGGATGVLLTLIWPMRHIIVASLGWPPPRPISGELAALEGGAGAVATFIGPGFLIMPMLGILSLVLLVIVLRKRWVAIAVLAVVIIGIGAFAALAEAEGAARPGLVTIGCLAGMVVLALALFLRSGLLALIVTFFYFSRLRRFPLTLDSSEWYSGTSALAMLALAAIAVYAFRTAIRGYPSRPPAGSDSSSIELPPR
jgi:hypothetical protein